MFCVIVYFNLSALLEIIIIIIVKSYATVVSAGLPKY